MSRRSRLEQMSWPWDKPDEVAHTQAIFLRGLSLGALIGAAIAGSALADHQALSRSPRMTTYLPT